MGEITIVRYSMLLTNDHHDLTGQNTKNSGNNKAGNSLMSCALGSRTGLSFT